MKNKYEEYDGYKMPEKQGFKNKAESDNEFKKHLERMKEIKEANNIK